MRSLIAGLACLALVAGIAFAEGDKAAPACNGAKKGACADAAKKGECADAAKGACKAGAKKECKQTRPTDEEIAKLATVTLKAEVKDGAVSLTWEPANDDTSAGVKVVASNKNGNPIYPCDGYVAWLEGTGKSSAVVENEKAAGKKYFRVCFVAKDHNVCVAVSNVVEVTPVEMTAETKAKMEAKKAEVAKRKAEKEAAKAAEKAAKEEAAKKEADAKPAEEKK